ncbi:LCCL domain containing protein [Ophiocordyceps camponoti-floridani]|uniref:LCCL domain containing protein n=1 Tax=Ophiocordyceps camponoti-floridani TaxID=2030778 RepID=A0A8H4Q4J4_9HYPO|nr:LCCL domain containing protein [Ophiocordyceps camponoti-floridani]
MAGRYHDEDESRALMTGMEQHEADEADAPGRADHDPDQPLDASLQVQDDHRPPTPRFLQDEQAWKRWKWVPYPARRFAKAMARWSVGPPDPRPYRIRPVLPAVQHLPLKLVDRFLPQRLYRVWLLMLYLSIWVITFTLVKRKGNMATEVAGWGQPRTIGCGASYWGAGNYCGFDGSQCRPFSDSGFAFRCPSSCANYMVLNPRAVGDQEVIYTPLVIGGPSNEVRPEEAVYRGDSYICAAAIHAGIITDQLGGCGVVNLVGRQQGFVSSQRNGITSTGFDSYFPLSFQFLPSLSCSWDDSRWSLLIVSVVFTAVLSLFTASPGLFFFSTFVGIFWTVGMALDPPSQPTVAALFSNVLGKFLPAMFMAWVMYDKMGVRRTLKDLTAQVEKTILWLGACWVGAMTNYTLNFIPIQRLNSHDINQQPGAKAALAIIVIVLCAVATTQVWFFRKEGRLVKYLKLYAVLLVAILVALGIPGLKLRLHHYILALVLLPGTSLQMRPSLLYQGLLVGLFINGVARWGFDPVLQTPQSLLGDAQRDSLLPLIHPPEVHLGGDIVGSSSNITFRWEPPAGPQYDGMSVLVNDVERFRTYFGDAGEKSEFVWSRNSTLGLPEYFRFAFMTGSDSNDYTRAGTWNADGQWKDMAAGPSTVKEDAAKDESARR